MNGWMRRVVLGAFSAMLVVTLLFPGVGLAASAREIDIKVDDAIQQFYKEVGGARRFVNGSVGMLVFPSVIKAGFGIGGEYGEGALRVKGKTQGYYSTAAASIGFQAGAQSKTVIMVFMTQRALDKFRNSEGWKAGVDGSVALIDLGAAESIDTQNIKDPIVGFIFGNKGLMYNLTLEGSKITRLNK